MNTITKIIEIYRYWIPGYNDAMYIYRPENLMGKSSPNLCQRQKINIKTLTLNLNRYRI